MIKQFLKLMVIAILFSRIEAVAKAQKLTNRYNSIAQVKQFEPETAQLNLVLPYWAKVILKSDGSDAQSKSGNLVSIDYENQQIQLAINQETDFINISSIQQISFRGFVVLKGREIYIRGTNRINQIPLVEKLSNFQLINPSTGTAKLQLTSIPDPENLAQDAYYIVREISFESPEIINIKYEVQP